MCQTKVRMGGRRRRLGREGRRKGETMREQKRCAEERGGGKHEDEESMKKECVMGWRKRSEGEQIAGKGENEC